MPDYVVDGTRRLRLKSDDVIGGGGEADIFKDGNFAVKIFKPPTHPDLAGNPQEQAAATARIAEHQRKLRAFPNNLPGRVVTPHDLVLNQKGSIVGYRMPLLLGAEVLYSYSQRPFREAGISEDTVTNIFVDLHHTVEAVHLAKVVIGDFNDLNVLVKGHEAYLIDADSMQFASFMTRTFTMKFVDPLHCDQQAKAPILNKPHSEDSDWYAFAVMLMQALLFVGPYGGVYLPKDPKKKIGQDTRPLRRITVFDPEVKYPKPARPFGILPDDVLSYFEQVFQKDVRGVTPRELIENLRFTTCAKCGTTHARTQCPSCVTITPPMQKEIHTGGVSAFKEFSTSGIILHAVLQGSTMRYLFHEDQSYKREGGVPILGGALDPHLRFRISGAKTLMGRGEQSYVFEGETRERLATDARGLLPLFDANNTHVFFARDGGLWRISKHGADYAERWGDVLRKQTLFWVGAEQGFGFYRAGELSMFFLFSTKNPGLNDSITLPTIRGQLIDAVCYFGSNRIWFLTATSENGNIVHRCHVLDALGNHLGSAEVVAGDGGWLGTIRGKCAEGDFLLSATDEGVARVTLVGAQLDAVKVFTATADFVDAESRLFLGDKGLYVVGGSDIWRLVLK